MSEIKVNKISPRTNCGTVQLGDSGDTITIPAGATITNNGTQTGFGRSGSVDWQTTPKTSTFTAVSGEGYFINQSSAITANLPAGSPGAIVAFSDYARNFATYNFQISANGSDKIAGAAGDAVLDVNGQAATFVYVDSTKGWINVQNAEDTEIGAEFVSATGGTITTVCTNFKVHTFTGPGTFCVSAGSGSLAKVDYLVIAGGGGSGGQGGQSSGGGGAGGYRESAGTSAGNYAVSPLGACVSALPVSIQGYPITVGAGGAGGSAGSDNDGNAGNPSVFSTITSAAGGFGGGNPGPAPGGNGGSGGGGRNSGSGGSGNTPPVSPPQGNDGGDSDGHSGSGGGGATGAGGDSNGPGGASGNGGVGGTSSINGTPTQRGGGGAGGRSPTAGASGSNSGGGGPGVGPSGPPTTANATANTGGGAGGVGNGPLAGATGGSGIVIIRYKFQ